MRREGEGEGEGEGLLPVSIMPQTLHLVLTAPLTGSPQAVPPPPACPAQVLCLPTSLVLPPFPFSSRGCTVSSHLSVPLAGTLPDG